jgi:hypothetical protein
MLPRLYGYATVCRFALIAAFLKLLCTVLLIIVSQSSACSCAPQNSQTRPILQIVSIRTTSTGVNLNCSADCDAFATLSKLDACCLRQEWQERTRFSWLSFSFDILEFISAFMFITPVLALADVWGRRVAANKLMLTAFIASAAISLLEFLFRAGTVSTSNFLASFTAMQTDAPIQMLSIAYRMAVGQGSWAFAADDLFLGIGLLASAYLTFRFGQLPRGFCYLGTATGSLSIISFVLELARFGEWQTLSIVSSVVYAFVGFICIPVWLIYLACFLGNYVTPDARAGLTDGFPSVPNAAFGAYNDVEDSTGPMSSQDALRTGPDAEDSRL